MLDARILPVGPVGKVTLRGAPEVLGPALGAVLGLDLPEPRMRTTGDKGSVLWMSPDGLLLLCDSDRASVIAERLTQALTGHFATVAVTSDARAVFDVAGPDAVSVLSKLAPVDFASLGPSEVRRTRLAQIPVALWSSGDGYRLMCFRSVAVYAQDLLVNAAA